MSSPKNSENIKKKEDGPYRSVSNNKFSSLTLNKLGMKARDIIFCRHILALTEKLKLSND